MNERIRELAEQAGIWKPTHDHKTWVRGEYVASPGELEKFAELIVRECTNICDDIADPTLYRGAEHHSRMAPGASYAAKVIKLRFGVEE